MDDLLNTVRSLQCNFVVTRRTDEEFVFVVDSAELAGFNGPATFRFMRPRRAWASRWDSVRGEWQDALELSAPMRGSIREARIKEVPAGITVSFSDKEDPLVRWGFIADGLSVAQGAKQS